MTAVWSSVWFWWLVAVAGSWLGLELDAVWTAHVRGERSVAQWTLSDTIRRWSSARRWVSPVVVGTAAFLLVHWFGVGNPR